MQLFTLPITQHIKPYLNRDDIYFIGLGKFDFQCAFDNIRFQSFHKISLSISGKKYEWEEGKQCAAPVWVLLGQVPKSCVLENADCLKLEMQSGDFIKLYTEEGPYECCIFEFPRVSDKLVMEIF